MAWIKIPAEHHPLFHAALPKDPRVSTVNMFGGVVAMVNGHMLGGLFGRGAFVRLSEADQKPAMALDGAEPFDPMGKGRAMGETVQLPESIMDEPDELKDWLRRALDYTATLPPKTKAQRARKRPTKLVAQPVKSAAAKPPKATHSKPAKATSKKAVAKRPGAKRRARR